MHQTVQIQLKSLATLLLCDYSYWEYVLHNCNGMIAHDSSLQVSTRARSRNQHVLFRIAAARSCAMLPAWHVANCHLQLAVTHVLHLLDGRHSKVALLGQRWRSGIDRTLPC